MACSNLKVASFNCKGFYSSTVEILELCEDHDIVFLQETWLSPQRLNEISQISKDVHTFAISSMDDKEKIHTGRPYGGTAILWKKSIDASRIVNYDNSIIGIKVNLEESYLTLVNVYLPYSCNTNVDAYLQYLSKLQNFYEEFGCNVSIIGDFNASEQKLFFALCCLHFVLIMDMFSVINCFCLMTLMHT